MAKNNNKPKDVGPKEEHEYERFKKDPVNIGRYAGKLDKVAKRVVERKHQRAGHKPGQ